MSLKKSLNFAQEIESVGPVIGQHKNCGGPVRSVLIKDINITEKFYCEACDKLLKNPDLKEVKNE